jgi:tetratricopeptide (TPR) repeat protein
MPSVADLERAELADVRDELHYLGGIARYQRGRFREAIELFDQIPATSPLFVKAKLFTGATHIREYQAQPAIAAFEEALGVSSAGPDADRGLRARRSPAISRT